MKINLKKNIFLRGDSIFDCSISDKHDQRTTDRSRYNSHAERVYFCTEPDDEPNPENDFRTQFNSNNEILYTQYLEGSNTEVCSIIKSKKKINIKRQQEACNLERIILKSERYNPVVAKSLEHILEIDQYLKEDSETSSNSIVLIKIKETLELYNNPNNIAVDITQIQRYKTQFKLTNREIKKMLENSEQSRQLIIRSLEQILEIDQHMREDSENPITSNANDTIKKILESYKNEAKVIVNVALLRENIKPSTNRNYITLAEDLQCIEDQKTIKSMSLKPDEVKPPFFSWKNIAIGVAATACVAGAIFGLYKLKKS